MLEATLDFREYNGALASLSLVGNTTTIVLGNFGPSSSGTVRDHDGIATPGETGMTLNGEELSVIGTGTAQAGINLGLVVVGLGPEVQVVLVENAAGDQFFLFPQGEPSQIGQIAMIITLDTSPLAMDATFTPICFVAGTPILTTTGFKKVDDIRAGDFLVNWKGEAVRVLWRHAQTVNNLHLPDRAHLRPVTFYPHAFGLDKNAAPVRVSANHRMLLSGSETELHFGSHDVLAPAKAFVDADRAHFEAHENRVTYHHILCERHTLVNAGGIWSETLLLGPVSEDIISENCIADIRRVIAADPQVDATLDHLREACLPILSPREAKLFQHLDWYQSGARVLRAA